MSELKTAKQHNAPFAGESELHGHAVDFKDYLRRCLFVFIAVLCAMSLMICASYLPHYGWPVKVALILAVACVNAFLVAGFLMHLLSEKKMIYTLLAFTVVFFRRADGSDGLRDARYARRARPFTDMSLKAVHLIFVSAADGAVVRLRGVGVSAPASRLFGAGGIAAGILVIVYGIYFLKKLKKMSYL